MKNKFKLIYIIVFFIICAIPTVFMFVIRNPVNYEKRTLASMPVLIDKNGLNTGFPSGFDSWYSDHFAFKAQLNTGYGSLFYYLLNESPNSKVIAGRQDWLFFNETIDDYTGKNLLTPRQIECVARTVELENNYLKSLGIPYVFTIAPNKNTLYGEFMPSRYFRTKEPSNLDILADRLKNSDVTYVDLKNLFLDLKNAVGTDYYYHKRDTHWNNLGALMAYRKIMSTVAEKVPDFVYDNYDDAKYTLEKTWTGDLDEMLLPALNIKDFQYNFNLQKLYTTDKPMSGPEDISIITKNPLKTNSLLIFRDSFYNSMLDFVSNGINSVDYSRAVPFQFNLAENDKPDAVVFEIVERNLITLINRAPVLDALRITLPDGAADVTDTAAVNSNKQGKRTKIYGWLPENSVDVDSKIYVRFTGKDSGETFDYEAFPILEADLEDSAPSFAINTGFSIYVDTNFINDNYNISIWIR
ncbi:MAG: hypothetical protein LBI03_03865 [Clostridiales bacterium]|nr:hypothetical protein [Clostridiales bacterium]